MKRHLYFAGIVLRVCDHGSYCIKPVGSKIGIKRPADIVEVHQQRLHDGPCLGVPLIHGFEAFRHFVLPNLASFADHFVVHVGEFAVPDDEVNDISFQRGLCSLVVAARRSFETIQIAAELFELGAEIDSGLVHESVQRGHSEGELPVFDLHLRGGISQAFGSCSTSVMGIRRARAE